MTASPTRRSKASRPVRYRIDAAYRRRRLLWWIGSSVVMIAAMATMSVLRGTMQPMEVVLTCAVMAVLLGIATMTRLFAWREYYLAVSDTELVLKTHPSRPAVVLPLSADVPLGIRRSRSGRYWQIDLPGRSGKPVELLFAAFPNLRAFLAKRKVSALVFEDSPRPDEPVAGQ